MEVGYFIDSPRNCAFMQVGLDLGSAVLLMEAFRGSLSGGNQLLGNRAGIIIHP